MIKYHVIKAPLVLTEKSTNINYLFPVDRAKIIGYKAFAKGIRFELGSGSLDGNDVGYITFNKNDDSENIFIDDIIRAQKRIPRGFNPINVDLKNNRQIVGLFILANDINFLELTLTITFKVETDV